MNALEHICVMYIQKFLGGEKYLSGDTRVNTLPI